MLSRFVALSVSLTPKASLLQSMAACSFLPIPNSTAGPADPCFAPVDGECFFACVQGFVAESNASAATLLAAVVKPAQHRAQPHQAAALGCHGGGLMKARWDSAVCVPVPCPGHSTATDGAAGTECRCDPGYAGSIGWHASEGGWVGRCIALPCSPALIAHSDRAAAACTAVTAAACPFTCDVGYRAHAGSAETGQEYSAHVDGGHIPGASSKSGSAVCDPSGRFVDAACFPVPCPLHGNLAADRHSCTCDAGFGGDVVWVQDGPDAVWSEPCVGSWVIDARLRAILFNLVAVVAVALCCCAAATARQRTKQRCGSNAAEDDRPEELCDAEGEPKDAGKLSPSSDRRGVAALPALREPRLARPLASHRGVKLPPLVLPKGQHFRVSRSTGAAYVVATGPDGVRSTQWIDAAAPPGSTFAGV